MTPDEEPLEDPQPEEGEEPQAEPLSTDERDGVQADLEDLDSMQAAFEPQGAKGVVIACADCGANHYYGWDLLKESLQHMLETGEPRMHEPAYQPREDDYVIWDYGKGYVDALADAGLEGGPAVELNACPWCLSPCEPQFTFCPACGRSLGPVRLLQELVNRGIDEQDARALLVRAGFEPFGRA
jgi:hypothetical protein